MEIFNDDVVLHIFGYYRLFVFKSYQAINKYGQSANLIFALQEKISHFVQVIFLNISGGHTQAVTGCCWKDNIQVITTSMDMSVKLWDTQALTWYVEPVREFYLFKLSCCLLRIILILFEQHIGRGIRMGNADQNGDQDRLLMEGSQISGPV